MTQACRVIAIFSPKGGVGKTLLACNLASALALARKRRVALMSVPEPEEDTSALAGSAGISPISSELLKGDPAALQDALRPFAYLIIDAGVSVTETAASAFEQSNLILLVTTPDVVTVRQTAKAAERLGSLGIPRPMVKILINRAGSHGNVRSQEVRASVPCEVIAEIPSDGRTACLALNQRLPLSLVEPGARITKALTQLARLLDERKELFVERVTLDRDKLPAQERLSAAAQAATGRPFTTGAPSDGVAQAQATLDPMVALKQRLHSRLVGELDLKRLELDALTNPAKAPELKQKVGQAVLNLLAKERAFLADADQRARLVKEIVDLALGLGPLEDLIADDEISDILVNGTESIYVEKRGKLSLTDRRFGTDEQLMGVIERIVAPLGRRIDESNPMVDARLPNGSRVNAIIPPLSLKGPMLSIRKFSRSRLTMEELVRLGTLTPGMVEFLGVCVRGRKNMLISGGTGSGKTTLLNALSAFIPDDERIATIEDAAELRLSQRHWIPLEARLPNIEGRGEVTIRQLFRNALRMRPNRIIIGECRGDETLDALQAMNTGHDGSIATLHANSPKDVIARLDSLVLMSHVDLPVRAIREQIASAIHLIIHTARLSDGSRKITHITEITGITEQADIQFLDVFVFRQRGVDASGRVLGEFTATGEAPTFLEELKAQGLELPETIFHQ